MSTDQYPEVVVEPAENGYVITARGDSTIDKTYVFESFESLTQWLKNNFRPAILGADSITQE